ncbi:MAG: hypothetical protein NT091_01375 [Candidatus Falkowbacteria bacterium]|nr:hypothetical protein [Candidatus Falkowbacteria bacterium]
MNRKILLIWAFFGVAFFATYVVIDAKYAHRKVAVSHNPVQRERAIAINSSKDDVTSNANVKSVVEVESDNVITSTIITE